MDPGRIASCTYIINFAVQATRVNYVINLVTDCMWAYGVVSVVCMTSFTLKLM